MKFIINKLDKYYSIEAIDNKETIGSITYIFNNKIAWITKIEVSPQYRNKGIGSMLIKIFENDCVDNYIRSVEGKFYPDGETRENVENFYLKNGYSVEKGVDDPLVYKYGLIRNDLSNIDLVNYKNNVR